MKTADWTALSMALKTRKAMKNVRNVAIIPEGRPDAGGSYVLLQKYLHDLKKWDAVPVAEQEASVGRSKEANEEFSKDVRLPDSHLGRVNLKENGVGLKIVRRSLPFGKISGEHGLMFTAYCHTLHNIEVQLLHMFGDADGKTDLLLKHLSTAISGAYYYGPFGRAFAGFVKPRCRCEILKP